MKILILDEEIPYPLNTGKRIRTFNLLKYLAGFHEIIFVCQKHDGANDNDSEALVKIGVRPIVVSSSVRPKKGSLFYLALFRNLFSMNPYSVDSHFSSEMVHMVNKILSEEQIDLIHCEWIPYAINMKENFHYPCVVDAHNVEALIWKRNYEVERNFFKKFYLLLQWKKMEQFEKRYFKKFTKIAAVSKNDRALISEWTSIGKIGVVDNGVDIEYFKKTSTNCEEETTIVFTGSMDWRPNIDGIFYFIDKIWPLVQREYSETKLYVVGRNPTQALRNYAKNKENIIITGTVDDVRPFIDRASVYIVPLRIGGGSRLKILEALSMEKAVVSTSIGAEGLSLENQKDLLIADTPNSFAEKIIALFKDKSLRTKLGKNGKDSVYINYQWAAISEKLNTIWKDTVRGE